MRNVMAAGVLLAALGCNDSPLAPTGPVVSGDPGGASTSEVAQVDRVVGPTLPVEDDPGTKAPPPEPEPVVEAPVVGPPQEPQEAAISISPQGRCYSGQQQAWDVIVRDPSMVFGPPAQGIALGGGCESAGGTTDPLLLEILGDLRRVSTPEGHRLEWSAPVARHDHPYCGRALRWQIDDSVDGQLYLGVVIEGVLECASPPPPSPPPPPPPPGCRVDCEPPPPPPPPECTEVCWKIRLDGHGNEIRRIRVDCDKVPAKLPLGVTVERVEGCDE